MGNRAIKRQDWTLLVLIFIFLRTLFALVWDVITVGASGDCSSFANVLFSYLGTSNEELSLCEKDGEFATVGDEPNSFLILDMGSGREIIDGPGIDFYYYERQYTPGILLDRVEVAVAQDNETEDLSFLVVFIWGDENPENNGTIPFVYNPEEPNKPINSSDLYYETGIGINIGNDDGAAYRFVRFQTHPIFAIPPEGQVVEVDAVEKIHHPQPQPTSTPTPTPTETPSPTQTVSETPEDFPTSTGVLSETPTEMPEVTPTLPRTDPHTPTPTNIATRSATYTLEVTLTATNAPLASPSFTNTPLTILTQIPSSTYIPSTSTQAITHTLTGTPSPIQTKIPTNTHPSTITFTPTDTASTTYIPTITSTPKITPSPNQTKTLTVTLTYTSFPTQTPKPRFTKTPTKTPFPYTPPALSNTSTKTSTTTLTSISTQTPTATLTLMAPTPLADTVAATHTKTSTPTINLSSTQIKTPTATPTSEIVWIWDETSIDWIEKLLAILEPIVKADKITIWAGVAISILAALLYDIMKNFFLWIVDLFWRGIKWLTPRFSRASIKFALDLWRLIKRLSVILLNVILRLLKILWTAPQFLSNATMVAVSRFTSQALKFTKRLTTFAKGYRTISAAIIITLVAILLIVTILMNK